GAQPACVLERVVEGKLHVLGTPQNEHRTGDRLELLTGIVDAQRLPRPVDVRVQEVSGEESFDGLVRERDGIGDRDESEHELPQAIGTRDTAAVLPCTPVRGDPGERLERLWAGE